MAGAAWIGIDRSQAESVMRMFGIKRKRQRRVLEALIHMENAAKPILNKR